MRCKMIGITSFLGVVLAGSLGVHGLDAPEPPDFSYILQHIQPSHPRLFLNQEMLEKIKQKGLTPEQQKWLTALTQKVDSYPVPPKLDDKLRAFMLSDEGGTRYPGKAPPRVRDGNWGFYSAHAALAYLLTGEKKYYRRAVEFLRHAAGVYTVIHENKRIPYNRSFVRLAALSAYDWLYNDLPEQERKTIGKTLFKPLHAFYKFWRQKRGGPGDLYTDTVMGWYLGLVFLHSGVEGADDQVCTQLLRDEYKHFLAVFDALSAGPDGVYLYGALGYATQNVHSEINFLDAWRSAIGGDFASYFPKRLYMAEYFLWNTIAPTRRQPFCYGWSDEYHTHNHMSRYHLPFLNRVADLCADVVDQTTLDTLTAIAQFQAPVNYQQCLDEKGDYYQTPAAPLLMSPKVCTEEEIQAALARLSRARHFPDPVGHTFMNSGWGADDTYAMFIAGRQTRERKHYDENHFTIYKKGFVALDSGARGYSVNRKFFGDGDPRIVGVDHEIHYYFNTIAHNSVLIHMEGEKLPGYWGQASWENTGGMNKNYGAQVKAFETNDRYTYIASDATACYHEGKSQEVVRQFLFVYPDYFVVFDRVASKTPQQKKTWLLHSQHEPVVRGDTFSADHREGRIFVRTLLPRELHSEKIGGPGKEFWTGTRNWPVRKDWQRLTPDQQVFGGWRVEISSAQDNQRELFLHLIQVGDRQQLRDMVRSERVDGDAEVGVEFQAGQAAVRVVFNRQGEVGGHIRISERGKVLVDRPLTREVMPQIGLPLAR